MQFFKHFTDAHRGQSLKRIRKQFGMAGVGQYWTLVELCAEKLEKGRDEAFTIEHCRFEFLKSHLGQELGTKGSGLQHILDFYQSCDLVQSKYVEDIVIIEMPKLLECLDRDTKRARPERVQAAPKNKKEDKDKELDKDISTVVSFAPPVPSPFDDEILNEPLKKVRTETQELWLKTYPEKDWVLSELKKAVLWISANPAKAPRSSHARFFTNWLSRGFENHRKQLPSNQVTPMKRRSWHE